MELIDVVRKLVGPIEPIGETNADAARYGNLVELTYLLAELIDDVERVSKLADRHEASIRKAGRRAREFITESLVLPE